MGPDSITIPPELITPPPRTAKMTSLGISNAIAFVIFLAFAAALGFWFGSIATQQMQHKTALRRDSREATAEVTRLEHVGRSNTPDASYSFTVDGAPFSGKVKVPRQLERNFYPFSLVPIRYLPSNPAVNHPAAWEDSDLSIWGPLILPLFIATTAVLGFAGLRKQRQLIIEGVFATGVVTNCTRYKGKYFLKCEFRTQNGQEIKGKGVTLMIPEIGATVPVLYLPQKPSRNQSYPLDLYRIAE